MNLWQLITQYPELFGVLSIVFVGLGFGQFFLRHRINTLYREFEKLEAQVKEQDVQVMDKMEELKDSITNFMNQLNADVASIKGYLKAKEEK